jgi:hypothetical protein
MLSWGANQQDSYFKRTVLIHSYSYGSSGNLVASTRIARLSHIQKYWTVLLTAHIQGDFLSCEMSGDANGKLETNHLTWKEIKSIS